jgi:pyruvate kinase
MKHTKIVCTIGPASESPKMLSAMLTAGMNVARLNFSHGTYENHAQLIQTIRAVSKKMKQPVAILK